MTGTRLLLHLERIDVCSFSNVFGVQRNAFVPIFLLSYLNNNWHLSTITSCVKLITRSRAIYFTSTLDEDNFTHIRWTVLWILIWWSKQLIFIKEKSFQCNNRISKYLKRSNKKKHLIKRWEKTNLTSFSSFSNKRACLIVIDLFVRSCKKSTQ